MSAHSQSPTAKQKLSAPSVYAAENGEIDPSLCCAIVYDNLAHDPQAGTITRSQPEIALTRKRAARTYTRRDQAAEYGTIRPIIACRKDRPRHFQRCTWFYKAHFLSNALAVLWPIRVEIGFADCTISLRY